MRGQAKPMPTVNELFEALKRTNLPTVLVEGKDDIVFYRKVEEELRPLGVDMLSAGNKDAVLELYKKIKDIHTHSPVLFIVDNDLWVHSPSDSDAYVDIIKTDGYSIENDLYIDGDLEELLSPEERRVFLQELEKFTRWYALSVGRKFAGIDTSFRMHPGKVLDDAGFYNEETALFAGETYPDALFQEILNDYKRLVRGKSLFALLLRQLSAKKRDVKFGARQLMVFGASRKGKNFWSICNSVRDLLGANGVCAAA